MKKLDLGQKITILANLGVIAGILFLGIELQQNNALLGAQARAARFEVAIDSTNMLVSTPVLARGQMKDRNGEPLTEEEEYILTEWYWGTFTRWQYIFGEYQAGLLERESIPEAGWRRAISSHRLMSRFWEENKDNNFRAAFVEFVENEILVD